MCRASGPFFLTPFFFFFLHTTARFERQFRDKRVAEKRSAISQVKQLLPPLPQFFTTCALLFFILFIILSIILMAQACSVCYVPTLQDVIALPTTGLVCTLQPSQSLVTVRKEGRTFWSQKGGQRASAKKILHSIIWTAGCAKLGCKKTENENEWLQ